MQIAHLEYSLDDSILTQRTLHLRIGLADVRLAMDRVSAKLRKKVDVPGFRKGKAPLSQVRKAHRKRVHAEAFEDLKKAALEQVFKKLQDTDQPFLPPKVVEREKVKLHYSRLLQFSVKYMVDPAGISKRPEQPDQAGAVIPGSQISHPALGPAGIPSGPRLPSTPGTPIKEPKLPGDEGE